MGACFSPGYACLHVGWWEERVLMVRHLDAWKNNILCWLRYIDDVFVIWKGSIESAQAFVTAINMNKSNLEFNANISKTSVEFLDVRMFVANSSLQSTLHRKSTVGNSTLHAHSFHPRHLIASIPFGEMLRLRRICSSEIDLRSCHADPASRFQARGYSPKDIKLAQAKANVIPRTELLASCGSSKATTRLQVGDNTAPAHVSTRFITTFSTEARALRSIISNHWKIIKTDSVLGPIPAQHPDITYRKASSMHNALVRNSPEVTSKSNWLTNIKVFFKCSSCRACKFGINTTRVPTQFRSSRIVINQRLSCRTDHAVYVLSCDCGLRYVGSTKLQVHMRILQHRRAIVNSDPTYPVARHFKEAHNNLNHLRYFIDCVPPLRRGGNREKILRQLESRYILLLNSKAPTGLNLSEDLHHFLWPYCLWSWPRGTHLSTLHSILHGCPPH